MTIQRKKLHKQGHSWRQWTFVLAKVFAENLKFPSPACLKAAVLRSAASPGVSTHTWEIGNNPDYKNRPLLFALYSAPESMEVSHGSEKMENIWIQVPESILDVLECQSW